jgi:hypothetical protein
MLLTILLILFTTHGPAEWGYLPKGPNAATSVCNDGRVTNIRGEAVSGRMAIDEHNEILRKSGGVEPPKIACR